MAANESAVQLDDLIIGVSYSLCSVVELVFYLPCLYVIGTDLELKKHSCFQMMFSLGVSDLINLLAQVIAGLLVMTRRSYQIPTWLNELFAGTHNGLSWFSYRVWICACWMYTSVWFVVYMSPYGGFIFSPSLYAFYFDATKPWYETLKTLAWWQNFVNLNGCAVWYFIILVWMRAKRNSMTTHQNEMQEKERRILYQASVIYIYTLLFDQYWHLTPVLVGKYEFKYAYTLWGTFCGWISNSAINPLVYFTMNKTIKRKVWKIFFKPANSRLVTYDGTAQEVIQLL